jgi:serine/threonine-protein kinase
MAERYRPLFKLDSGGMAEVYVAESEAIAGFKKKVAIKRILPGLIKDERFVRMFLDEARLSLHLNHANVVSVFDIGKSDSTYFIVMEYVEGTNLKSLLEHMSARGQALPVALTVWILNEILKGLDYAHDLTDPDTGQRLGLVHRDISPPNVLISWNGEVKITDFGLAKATTQLESTDPGVVKGKFSYLSPEAAHGIEVDRRADIFAVGIMAFEMLTGRRLFLGETDYQTVELVRRAQVPSIQAINPHVPDPLERIIRRCLAREPDHRHQTCGELADDLLGFLFAHGMKVSSRDVVATLLPMREAAQRKRQLDAGGLILSLIDDELLSFRSIDAADDVMTTGAQPLAAVGTAASSGDYDYDASAPLAVDDFGSGGSGGAGVVGSGPVAAARGGSVIAPLAGAITTAQAAQLAGGLAGSRMAPIPLGPDGRPASGPAAAPIAYTRLPSPAPKRERGGRGLAIALVILLLLGLAGGGAYYWLIVLGHLADFQ